MTRPKVGSMRRSIRRPSVLLPQPLSPSRPIVSPRRTRIDTPSTARTKRPDRPNHPPSTGKYFATRSVAARVRGLASAGGTLAGSLRSSAPGRRSPAGAHGLERRLLAIASLDPQGAPIGEAASRGEPPQVRHHPLDGTQALLGPP